jgi:class 3 adenylate cyclase
MAQQDADGGEPGRQAGFSRCSIRGSLFLRQVARQSSLVGISLLATFVLGVLYRLLFNPVDERTAANFARSGVHAVGLAVTVWVLQTAFLSGARDGLASRLRQLPVAAEVVVRAAAMTVALIVVRLTLQALLYVEPYHLHWLTRRWLTTDFPRIIAVGFGFSLVIGIAAEIRRLIGDELLLSVILGTYRRPSRQIRIVMFLDLAHSTLLAERLGELRVHDLITRFFIDIDDPVSDFGGAVHAYVGDEVIATWPVTNDPVRDARCVACFFAIRRKMAGLASDYERAFGVAPEFRAGIHAGAIVISACGDAKRQLALFGDTMNVAARPCDYCKSVDAKLVISGSLMRLMATPPGLVASEADDIAVRGRHERIEAHVIAPGD